MKKLLGFTFCLCTLVMVLSSCSKNADNGIYGKWEQTVEQGTMTATVTYDFKTNGILTQTMVMRNEEPVIEIEGEGNCRYTYEGDVISFNFSGKDFNFSKFKMAGYSDDMIESMMEQMKAGMVNVEQQITDVKIEGDELTGMFNGQKITLNRM